MTAPFVIVTHYTDPWSVWCWAIEPQLLRLRERHGSRLQLQVKLGAILETPPPPGFPREEVVRMFAAARRQSGMPLDPEIVLKKETPTTNRAGIAAKAVALVDPARAERYLRDLRFAALVEGRDIESLDVQEEIASAAGVDAALFREAIESDEAQREFYGDQAEARVRGITGFPTVTFRGAGTNAGREVGVAGFQPTEAYEAALARVSGARWVEDPPPDLRTLLQRRGPLATAEVAEVFDVLEDAATLELLALEKKGAARHVDAAGGLFWRAD